MNIITIVATAIIFAAMGMGFGWYMGARQLKSPSQTNGDSTLTDLPSFETLINDLAFAVLIIDRNGIVVSHNGKATDLAHDDSIKGRQLNDILHLKDLEGKDTQLTPSTTDDTVDVRRDIVLGLPDSEVALEATMSSFKTQKGEIGGSIIILRDISGEKTLEQKQNEFISTAWHELRTPLAIAEGYVSTSLHKLGQEANGDTQLVEWLNKAHANILGLSKLANDLGTLYLSEKDSLLVRLETINAGALLKDVVELYRKPADEKHITIQITDSRDDITIVNSTSLLTRILSEMVENAVKFTPQGEVICSVTAATDGSQDIIFSVTDNGEGIAESLRPNLFRQFFRGARNFETTGERGIGIGLAITARLAERLGGKIWYEDSKDKGSTFHLQMPPYSADPQDTRQVTTIETQRLFESI